MGFSNHKIFSDKQSMLFDINRVKKNKMRSGETRSKSFLLKEGVQ